MKEGFDAGPSTPPRNTADREVTCPECMAKFRMIALPAHYTRSHKADIGMSWDAWTEHHGIQRLPTARRNDRPAAIEAIEASPGGRHHCDFQDCTYVARTKKQLTAHRLSHVQRTASEIIKCTICGHPCKGPGGISKHTQLAHPEGTFREGVHTCSWPQCNGLSFRTPARLTRHINEEHSRVRKRPASARAPSTPAPKAAPLKSEREQRDAANERYRARAKVAAKAAYRNNEYHCPQCGFTTSTRTLWEKHQTTTHGRRNL